MWAAVGIHPHDAAASNAETVREIERLATSPRVVAIGEIGLDFFRNLSPPDVQAWTFCALLEVAGRLAKPVLIHCREAHDETLAILAEARLGGTGGIMHCFSGDVAIARRCRTGLTISLAGPVTYPNARARSRRSRASCRPIAWWSRPTALSCRRRGTAASATSPPTSR